LIEIDRTVCSARGKRNERNKARDEEWKKNKKKQGDGEEAK
jgi:hypothetical protein